MVARFQQALQEAEEKKDPQAVASLFHEGAKLSNLGGDHGDDPRKFWQRYLDQFSAVHSEFCSDVVSETSAALE